MVPNWTQNGAKMEEFLKPNPPKMKTKSNEAWIKTSVKFLMLLSSRRISRAAAALNGLVGLPRSAKNLVELSVLVSEYQGFDRTRFNNQLFFCFSIHSFLKEIRDALD